VVASHGGDTQEDKDEGLTHAAPHLKEILDGGVGLVGDVGFHIGPHDHARGNEPRGKVGALSSHGDMGTAPTTGPAAMFCALIPNPRAGQGFSDNSNYSRPPEKTT